ncbi:MAG: hypothetical protein ACT4NY_26520 [Pseudonocardiales bacterium]
MTTWNGQARRPTDSSVTFHDAAGRELSEQSRQLIEVGAASTSTSACAADACVNLAAPGGVWAAQAW